MEFPWTGDEIPSPNLFRENFLFYPQPHWEKFPNFNSPKGAIFAEIPIYE
jgi:hypothetical protein